MTYLESRANSNYQSLQARFQQRVTRGVSTLVSYTFAKSIDDASGIFASTGDPNFPQDSNHVGLERGLSNFDVRHRAVFSYTYQLPFGDRKWWGGWETSGIWQFQSGRPFTVALLPGVDNSNTGIPVLGFGSVDRPNELSNPNNGPKTVDQWFNTAAFKISPYGTFGSAGRNIVQGPGLASINLALVKNTALGERMKLQFRAEFFNAFDRANFGLPNNFIGSPAFGRITSAGDPRRVQLALKLLF